MKVLAEIKVLDIAENKYGKESESKGEAKEQAERKEPACTHWQNEGENYSPFAYYC